MSFIDEPIATLHQEELCEIEHACMYVGLCVGVGYESECVAGELLHSR